jgi:phosphohistidine phosphatase
MELILVRHADAGDRDEFAKTGNPDSLRPLSPKGWKRGREAAMGVRSLAPACDVCVTSPLVRAHQTADIIVDIYGIGTAARVDALEPDAALDAFEAWLGEHQNTQTVIAVGHEPHLGHLATWLIADAEHSGVVFRKSGACLITFDSAPTRGRGRLSWLLGPRALRRLGTK